MKKKFVAGILLAAVVASMTACGTPKVSSTATETETSESEAAEEDVEEETAEEEVAASSEAEAAGGGVVESADAGEEETEETAAAVETGVIDFSQVLADNDVYKFEVTSIEVTDDYYAQYVINATIENKSDTSIYIDIEDSSVNGIMAYTYLSSSDIMSGKKANATISWYMDNEVGDWDDLATIGIEEVTQVEFTLQAEDADTYDDLTEPETFTIYPLGEENAVITEREPQDTDQVMVDNDQIAITLLGSRTDESGYFYLDLYIQNKTDLYLDIDVDDTSVDDIMCDGSLYAYLPAGKCAYSSITFYPSELEDNGLSADTLQNIEFTIEAEDWDSWEEIYTGTFTYTVG